MCLQANAFYSSGRVTETSLVNGLSDSEQTQLNICICMYIRKSARRVIYSIREGVV